MEKLKHLEAQCLLYTVDQGDKVITEQGGGDIAYSYLGGGYFTQWNKDTGFIAYS